MQPENTLYKPGLVVTTQERETVFALRSRVFVEEQKVPAEEEFDADDLSAVHFLIRTEPPTEDYPLGIVGTARLLNYSAGIGKIGRVAVERDVRGFGVGLKLMEFIELHAKENGYRRLILDSQVYAMPFYTRLGYVAEGETFMDANIPHRRMTKNL